ncbi:hypothetical protein F5884DRAFT_810674 [Xylogone sp. PMI_703]|nr:hypothetical protein F5884DRAFT_810674 [Xylogone sp. PMI_703]
MAPFDPERIATLFLQLYTVLIDMRFIPASRLHQAPHNPPINTEKCRALGMSPEVIDLLERLPYLVDSERYGTVMTPGYVIAPGMLSLSFLPDPDSRDALHIARDPNDVCGQEITNENAYIEPWSVTLTRAQYRESPWVVLNTKENIITDVNWSERSSLWPDPPVGSNRWYYNNQPAKPAEQFLEDWIQKFVQLEWVPYRSLGGPGIFMQGNREYPRLRNLYRSNGWLNNFRPEEFLRGLEEFNEEEKEIDIQQKESVHPGYRAARLLRETREREAREAREVEEREERERVNRDEL